MTRVDFYILPDHELSARQAFACRLVQKACRIGHKIYVHCSDEAGANQIDSLLWSFQDNSFIPHRLAGSGGAECPVEIGYGDNAGNHHDLLVNLALSVPPFFSGFERVAEIVVQDPAVLEATRDSYKYYSRKNYPLSNHDLRTKA